MKQNQTDAKSVQTALKVNKLQAQKLAKQYNVPIEIFDIETSDEIAELYLCEH